MSTNKVKKTVSFNITNKDDLVMLEHIEEINFSGYVKELIYADIQRRNQSLKIIKKTNEGGIKIVVGG